MAKQSLPKNPYLTIENKFFENPKIKHIAGIDEVGRGALAGPMVIGCVILNKSHLIALASNTNNDVQYLELAKNYNQIKDSKKLTPKKRVELEKFIKSVCISYSIEVIDSKTIDKLGLASCTQIGFLNSVNNLKVKPGHILTDAFKIKTLNDALQTNIKHGDALSITIATASIIAKVYRDNLMVKLHNTGRKYKKYHFHKNKAYGTKEHIAAIRKYGVSDQHRKTFEPIKSLLKQTH